MILDGPMDGDAFRTYVTAFLAPTLRAGNVVMMNPLQKS
jgi:hypothetical protein